MLCHPNKIKEFETIIISKNYSPLKSGKVCLKHQDLEDIKEALGLDNTSRPYLEIVHQHSGMIVNVPPGWTHMVLNLQVGHTITFF